MVAVFRPISVRPDSHVEALRMKTGSGKDVVDVVALIHMMVKIEGLFEFFTVPTAVLQVIETVISALAE